MFDLTSGMLADAATAITRGLSRFGQDVRDRGLARALDLVAFRGFYGTRNPAVARRLMERFPYPTYLEVELTTRCNLGCVMCEHTWWDEPQKDLTASDFRRIIAQFPHLWWIGLTGIGESFMHRRFFDALEIVKARGAFVELYDTMHLVGRRRARRIVELGVDRVLVSLDAATPSTYESLRVGSRFDRVVRNVRQLVEEKARASSRFPTLDFHFIVMRPNMHEMIEYLYFVRDLAGPGATVFFSRMLHSYPEVEDLFVEVPRELKEDVEEEGRRLELCVSWNADSVERKPSCRLCTEWTMPFIFSTGEVIPCCAQNEANRRGRQKRLAMGNVLDTPFSDIWYGERYRELISSLMRGRQPDVCHDCPLYKSDTS